MIHQQIVIGHVPPHLSKDQGSRSFAQSDAPYAATSPLALTVRSRRNRTLQITPRHLRTFKISKKLILIRTFDF